MRFKKTYTDETPGTVYLIHFARKLAHAQHYLGWTTDLPARLKEHRAGRWEPCDPYKSPKYGTAVGQKTGDGALILAVCNYHGIEWDVVRTWDGTPQLEARFKRYKAYKPICPTCNGEKALTRGLFLPRNLGEIVTPEEPLPASDWPSYQYQENDDAELPF